MERKIGEIFEHNGEWYQCLESNICRCDYCDYGELGGCNKIACASGERSDNKEVCFKKLEKVGDPFSDKLFGLVQKYELKMYGYSTKDKRVCFADGYDVFIKPKQTKEDMEEKNNGNTPLNVLTDKYVNGYICYDDFEKEVKALYSCKEEIKPNLKEFDLEAAKAGKPVCTMDGRKAMIICFDRKLFFKEVSYPILALVERSDGEDDVCAYNEKGKVLIEDGAEYKDDLMMLPEKRSGWAKVRKDINLYDTKEEADRKMIGNDEYVTAKICWEE